MAIRDLNLISTLLHQSRADEGYGCFINVPVSGELIASAQAEVLRKIGVVSEATNPDQFHVTLVYVNDCPEESINIFRDDLALPVRTRARLTDLAILDGGDKPALVWMIDPGPGLSRLQSDLYYRALNAGLSLSDFSNPRIWKPHLTLAYFDTKPEIAPGLAPDPMIIPISGYLVSRDDFVTAYTVDLPSSVGDLGYIERDRSQLLALMRGESVVSGPLRRVFSIRGGEGSGYHDPHYGRPNEVGGSSPREGGRSPQPERFDNGPAFPPAYLSGLREAIKHTVDGDGRALTEIVPVNDVVDSIHSYFLTPDGTLVRSYEEHSDGALAASIRVRESGVMTLDEVNEVKRIGALDAVLASGSFRLTVFGKQGVHYQASTKATHAQRDTAQQIAELIGHPVWEWTADTYGWRGQPLTDSAAARLIGLIQRGGPGSGHFGHAGRPEEIGGSLPGDQAGASKPEAKPEETPTIKPSAKSGRVSSPGSDKVAEKVVADAQAREPALTATVQEIVNDLGGELHDPEFRLKSKESLSAKINANATEQGISLEEASDAITDVNRYTMSFDAESFGANTMKAQDALAERGWRQYDHAWKNYFGSGDAYDGYNAVFQHERTGAKMEVQFHTSDSYQIKKMNTPKYERFRTLPAGDSQRLVLWDEMMEAWDSYVKPQGWESLPGTLIGVARSLVDRGGPGSGYSDPHKGRPGEVGGSSPRDGGAAGEGNRPSWAGEGESQRVDGLDDSYDVYPGKYAATGRFAVARPDDRPGPFEDTPKKAVEAYERMHRESEARGRADAAHQAGLARAIEGLRSGGEITEAMVNDLSGGRNLIMTREAEAFFRNQVGMKAKDAKAQAQRLGIIAETRGGALLRNPREVLQRAKWWMETHAIERGGPGSGFFDHAGRPGELGGSIPMGETPTPNIAIGVGEDDADGSKPDVGWFKRDLQDSTNDVSAKSIRADYANGDKSATIYNAWIPISDLPTPQLAEEMEDNTGMGNEEENGEGWAGGGYDWEQYGFKQSGGWPPIKIEVEQSGEVKVLDGNHRLVYWEQQDHQWIPAWVVDRRPNVVFPETLDEESDLEERGGLGSGYGDPHYGRPGEVGGSSPRGDSAAVAPSGSEKPSVIGGSLPDEGSEPPGHTSSGFQESDYGQSHGIDWVWNPEGVGATVFIEDKPGDVAYNFGFRMWRAARIALSKRPAGYRLVLTYGRTSTFQRGRRVYPTLNEAKQAGALWLVSGDPTERGGPPLKNETEA